MQPIILASQSPRRKLLLEWAEVPFEIIVKATDETYPLDLPAEQVPEYIAAQKAITVHEYLQTALHGEHSNTPILAADTIVVLDNEIIGKPKDKEHAIETLKKLSGKQHRVITGVIIYDGKKKISFHDITFVEFHPLSDDDIEFYIEKYKPYDKAGAYAIQEWIGVVGIKNIVGDFYNVMGLPVSRVIQALLRFNK
jgi:septum formation protein